MAKKRSKLFLIGLASLCALVLASGIASLGVVRAGGDSTTFSYETDVVAKWGEWSYSENNATVANKDKWWNDFLVTSYSPSKNDYVVYRTDMKVHTPGGAGLTFGMPVANDPGGNPWYCLMAWYDEGTNTVSIRLFKEGGANQSYTLPADVAAQDSYELEVRISDGGIMRGYVNGKKVLLLDERATYNGGHVGHVVYGANADFKNTAISITGAPTGAFSFDKNIAYQWGSWSFDGDKAVAANSGAGWNDFIMTDYNVTKAQNVYMSAEVTLDTVGGMGFVYGMPNPSDPGPNAWWCYNIVKEEIEGKQSAFVRLFSVNTGDGAIGDTHNYRYNLTDEEFAAGKWTLELRVGSDGIMRGSLNGRVVVVARDNAYNGGYLGYMVWNANGAMDNAKIEVTNTVDLSDPFVYEDHRTYTWGNWSFDGNKATVQNWERWWDEFMLTDICATKEQEVVMKADVAITAGGGTGFAFGMPQPHDPGAHPWYALNFYKSSDTEMFVRFFSVRTGEGAIGDTHDYRYNLTTEQIAKGKVTIELRVVSGGVFLAYVDGKCVAAVYDPTYNGGYLGLQAFSANATYENTVFTVSDPDLSNEIVQNDGYTYVNALRDVKHSWGTWIATADRYVALNNKDGDLFAMTDIFVGQNQDLIFEADVTQLSNSYTAALVFGVPDKQDPGAGWYAQNIQYGEEKFSRLYAVGTGTIGAGLDMKYEPISDLTDKTHHMRIEAYANGTIRTYLDGELFAETYDSKYNGGYLGFSTFYGNFMFENVRYKTMTADGKKFETDGEVAYDVDSYRSGYTWSSWSFDAAANTITASNPDRGNEFSMSTLYVAPDQNFSFEADLLMTGTSACIAFGVDKIEDPIKGWYALAVSKTDNYARIFSESKGSFGNASKCLTYLTEEQKGNTPIRLRVEGYASGLIKAWVDGKLIANEIDPLWNGGYIGFNTFFATATFSNMTFSVSNNDGGLTALALDQGELNFDAATYGYGVELAKGTESVTVTATADDGKTVRINGEVATEKEIVITAAKTVVTVEVFEGESRVSTYDIMVKRFYDEPLRPQLHFTEKETWINDPNGLVYDEYSQTYHMFYQYCEGVNNNGWFYWGHATSKDLVHWERKEPAIAPDQGGVIFSGSAIIDKNNDSGLFDDSVPAGARLLAFYTYHSGNPKIGLAYSTDFGETWQKYGIVIANENNMYTNHFRDPKVISAHGKWLMVVGGWTCVRLFSSTDLIHWELDSVAKDYLGEEIWSECPDLFPLAVDGDENNQKWVLSTGGTTYVVGDLILDEQGKFVFNALAPGYKIYQNVPLWSNIGEMYATQSYYNDKLGRRILVSWMVDRTANVTENKWWNGAESLPLETDLITKNGMYVLLSYPVVEVDSMRKTKLVDVTEQALTAGADNLLSGVTTNLFDLELDITLGTARYVTLNVIDTPDAKLILTYDAKARVMNVTVKTAATYQEYRIQGSVTPIDGKLHVRFVYDVSIFEIFVNRGEQSFHGMVFPDSTTLSMSLSVDGGEATVNSLGVWSMGSMYDKEGV